MSSIIVGTQSIFNVTYFVTSPSNIYLCNRDSGTAIKSSIYFLSVSYDGNYHQFLTQLSELVIFLLASQNIRTTPCETLLSWKLTVNLISFHDLSKLLQGEEEGKTGITFAFAG